MNRKLIPIILILITLVGCEKKIDLELPSSSPKLVVDGWFTNQTAPNGETPIQKVRLTMSTPYFSTSEFKAVKDAFVTLKDNRGNSFPLTFKAAQIMENDKIVEDADKGQYELARKLEDGVSYTLFIRTSDGKEYESTPQKVISYSLTPKISYEYKEEDDGQFDESGYYISYEPQYPQEGEFYFTWQLYREESYPNYEDPDNTQEIIYSYPYSEILYGSTVFTSVDESQTYFDLAAQTGDRYFIKQHVISKSAWDFIRMAQEQRDNDGTMFSPPAAPLRGNIKRVGGKTLDDDALGLFIISSVQKTPTLTIEESNNN